MSQLSDPIADFLTRLRNAGAALKPEVLVPYVPSVLSLPNLC